VGISTQDSSHLCTGHGTGNSQPRRGRAEMLLAAVPPALRPAQPSDPSPVLHDQHLLPPRLASGEGHGKLVSFSCRTVVSIQLASTPGSVATDKSGAVMSSSKRSRARPACTVRYFWVGPVQPGVRRFQGKPKSLWRVVILSIFLFRPYHASPERRGSQASGSERPFRFVPSAAAVNRMTGSSMSWI
jgi:hypothetical protein